MVALLELDTGGDHDLVSLRRPGAGSELDVHPCRCELAQACPVELDGVEHISAVPPLAGERNAVSVGRVARGAVVPARVRGDLRQSAASVERIA